jgi:hypothetical protein
MHNGALHGRRCRRTARGGRAVDLYQTWLYREVINSVWMLRAIVFLVLVGNLMSPILIWYLMSGRNPSSHKKRES